MPSYHCDRVRLDEEIEPQKGNKKTNKGKTKIERQGRVYFFFLNKIGFVLHKDERSEIEEEWVDNCRGYLCLL